ncbi:hypothetical protein T11_7752 [Trichinella zimbabwensis]|uniref:Uncharacterized protein n=1 Tax=Trichinella zimbabwensis TaxID=268475 RepID=A0A0V1GCP9_9BILA|nr:hypothetical protein T11_7752 [Trichinella zimbabwensis]
MPKPTILSNFAKTHRLRIVLKMRIKTTHEPLNLI